MVQQSLSSALDTVHCTHKSGGSMNRPIYSQQSIAANVGSFIPFQTTSHKDLKTTPRLIFSGAVTY